MSHYQPLLPAPEYMTQLAYQARLRQLGNRYHSHLMRQRHPTANQFGYADDFDKQALDAAMARLKASPLADAAVQATEIATAKAQYKPAPVFGVHAHKLRIPRSAPASSANLQTTPDPTAPVRLGR